MLQNETEICWGLVFVFELFAIVHIYIVELDETHQVTRCLALPFGYIINSRGPQQEEALFPRLLAILPEIEHPL